MRHAVRCVLLSVLGLWSLACAGNDDARQPLGGSCAAPGGCQEGECLAGVCLVASADEDGDGLANGLEASLGLDLYATDSDHDGLLDTVEVGDPSAPTDTDGDSRIDALESQTADADGDCLVDARDPDDTSPADAVALGGVSCLHTGVCGATGAVVRATCAGGAITCDYSGVPGYQAPERDCNDRDDDCNGVTDDPFAAGGTVVFTDVGGNRRLKGQVCGTGACAGGHVVCGDASTLACSSAGASAAERCNGEDDDCDGFSDEDFFRGGAAAFDGGPLAADAGKGLGDPCGAGACANGTVICDAVTQLATCSSLEHVTTPACDADKDCDGKPDQGIGLVGCTAYFADPDGDNFGTGTSRCLCFPEGDYSAPLGGDCDEVHDTVHPYASVCGVDGDCDHDRRDLGEACDDGNTVFGDGCHACALTEATLSAAGFFGVIAVDTSGAWAALWDDWDGGKTMFFGADDRGLARLELDSPYATRSIAALRSGGYVVTSEELEFGGYEHLRAAHYDAAGILTGSGFDVPVSPKQYTRQFLSPLDGARALYVVHQDSTETDPPIVLEGIYIAADATYEGGSWTYTLPANATEYQALGLANGEALVAWRENPALGQANYYAQRISVAKEASGAPFILNDKPELYHEYLALAARPDGGFAALYSAYPGENYYAQRFKADGSFDGAPIRFATGTSGLFWNYMKGAFDAQGSLGILALTQEAADGEGYGWAIPTGSIVPRPMGVNTQPDDMYVGGISIAGGPTGFRMIFDGLIGQGRAVSVRRTAPNGDTILMTPVLPPP